YLRDLVWGMLVTSLLKELEGKTILVGTDLTGVDHIEPPLHAMMPGVFIHAVALEQLQNEESSYVRWPGDPGSDRQVNSADDQIEPLIAWILIVILVGLRNFRKAEASFTYATQEQNTSLTAESMDSPARPVIKILLAIRDRLRPVAPKKPHSHLRDL